MMAAGVCGAKTRSVFVCATSASSVGGMAGVFGTAVSAGFSVTGSFGLDTSGSELGKCWDGFSSVDLLRFSLFLAGVGVLLVGAGVLGGGMAFALPLGLPGVCGGATLIREIAGVCGGAILPGATGAGVCAGATLHGTPGPAGVCGGATLRGTPGPAGVCGGATLRGTPGPAGVCGGATLRGTPGPGIPNESGVDTAAFGGGGLEAPTESLGAGAGHTGTAKAKGPG